jgi:hypothetical protein
LEEADTLRTPTLEEGLLLKAISVEHVALNIETVSSTPRSLLFHTPHTKLDSFDDQIPTVGQQSNVSSSERPIPAGNRNHPLSDGEVDYYPHPSSYPGPDRIKGNGMPRGPMSDTEVGYDDQGEEEEADAWHWNWGGLPQFGEDGMDYDEKVESFLAGMDTDASPPKGAAQVVDSFMDSIEVSLCGLKAIRGAPSKVCVLINIVGTRG